MNVMDSFKVIIFSPSDSEGSEMLQDLFQKEFNIPESNRESLLFNYITFTVDIITVDWKIYLVSDMEKFKEIRPLYFSNVHAFIVVLDSAHFSPAWENFVEAIKSCRGDSRVICLMYSGKDDDPASLAGFEEIVVKDMAQYFQFSERSDLEGIVEFLFQGRGGLRSPNHPAF